MRSAALVAAIVLTGAWVAHAWTPEFSETPASRQLARAFSRTIAKGLPIPAASSGISFEFNPKTSAFERSTELLGQLFLERARPIGRGKLNLSVTYQYVGLDTYEGHDLDSLSDRLPIVDQATDTTFIIPHVDVDLAVHMMTPSLTYGVTDDLEVNLTVPVLYSSFESVASLRQVESGFIQRGSTIDHAFGVGDIILRGKYRLAHGWFGDLAVGLLFRLPSGDAETYQGTDLFEVDPRLYATTPAVPLAPRIHVQAFFDGGFDLTPQNVKRSEGRYGIGIDVMFASRATMSLAFLGREPFRHMLGGNNPVELRRADGTITPIFGIDPGRPSYYDLSIGGRVNLWGDTLFLMGNVIVPLNDDGVRPVVIPLIGIEATF
jgi:hypothetical protein